MLQKQSSGHCRWNTPSTRAVFSELPRVNWYVIDVINWGVMYQSDVSGIPLAAGPVCVCVCMCACLGESIWCYSNTIRSSSIQPTNGDLIRTEDGAGGQSMGSRLNYLDTPAGSTDKFTVTHILKHTHTLSVWNSSLFASLLLLVPSSTSLLCSACLELSFFLIPSFFSLPIVSFYILLSFFSPQQQFPLCVLWQYLFLGSLDLYWYSSFHTLFSLPSHHLSSFSLTLSQRTPSFWALCRDVSPSISVSLYHFFLYIFIHSLALLPPSLQHSVSESLAVYCMVYRGTCLWYPGA